MSKESKRGEGLYGLVVLCAVVVIVWLAAWGLLVWAIPVRTDRGPFGDMFGAVNSLFSGLAFAGVIYTILLQQRELALQREEMRLSRLESARIARSGGQAAEIAALAQLSGFYLSTIADLEAAAYDDVPDAASPTGVTREILDPDAAKVVDEAGEKYMQVMRRIESLREEIAGAPLEDDDGFFDTPGRG